MPEAAWAKSPRGDEGEQEKWMPLTAHLQDAGHIARLLWDKWAGQGVRESIARDFGGNDELAGQVYVFAASVHDIAKLTPAFAGQVGKKKLHMERNGYVWPSNYMPESSRDLPHARAGHLIISKYLTERGVPKEHSESFAVLVGAHHGVPPTEEDLVNASHRADLLGTGKWRDARHELLGQLVTEFDSQHAIAALQQYRISDSSQMLLSGLIIIADWIASNENLFPLVPAFEQIREPAIERAQRAWKKLAFPQPWLPTEESLHASATDLLRSRFKGADKFVATPMQGLVAEMAREMTEPGLLIIEAVMGAGKTEGSLMAAEIFARKFKRSGCAYFLPTRATTDAMFQRVLPWWQMVPGAGAETARSVQLRHSGAPLNPALRALPRHPGSTQPRTLVEMTGPPADVGRDEHDVAMWGNKRDASYPLMAHYWHSGRKQAALADTVIATIDHELMAALASRHVMLRHIGMARQVVVLDEIHAADIWMRTYLLRAIEWLGSYGVPVIALSATLPPDQRQALAHAYLRGRAAREEQLFEELDSSNPLHALRVNPIKKQRELPEIPENDAYPLITAVQSSGVRQETVPAGRTWQINIDFLPDDLTALTELLQEKLSDGGCAVVICNTVARAIERYRALSEIFPDQVTLAHSRYIARDRAAKDSALLDDFGPRSDASSRAGRIVVATQVVEQSLDVDFDIMITDLAPVDLLLQRAGRLHRHPHRQRPEKLQKAELYVTAFTDGDEPETEKGAGHIYTNHLLLRSAALVKEFAGKRPLTMPADVPALVRRCYGDEVLGPGAWQDAMRENRKHALSENLLDAKNSEKFSVDAPEPEGSLIGAISMPTRDLESDEGAQRAVRKGDGSIEVILLRQEEDGLSLLPHFDDDRVIPTDVEPSRELVDRMGQSFIRLHGQLTRFPRDLDNTLDVLAANYYPGWQKNPVIGQQLILLLDKNNEAQLGRFTVKYSQELGLELTTNG